MLKKSIKPKAYHFYFEFYLKYEFCFPLIFQIGMCLLFAVPPHVAPLEFSDNPVNSDDMVSVSCIVAKGDFPLDIVWLLNGRLIDNILGISVVKTNRRISQLNIDSVQADHIGKYTCLAKNPAGSTSSSTILHVNGIHSFVFFYFS